MPEQQLQAVIEQVFYVVKQKVAEQLDSLLHKADQDDETERLLNELDLTGLLVLSDEFQKFYETVAKDGVAQAFMQIGITDQGITDLANEDAIAWAKEQAAELVGKKWVDGVLVDNPDARWVITEGTRDMLRETVAEALDKGWSNWQLAQAIGQCDAFSSARAQLIATTETAFSDVQGNLIAYRQSGVVTGKKWLTGAGCCDLCAALNGDVVGLDEDFIDGIDAPPYHPRCRCDVLPVTGKQETEQ